MDNNLLDFSISGIEVKGIYDLKYYESGGNAFCYYGEVEVKYSDDLNLTGDWRWDNSEPLKHFLVPLFRNDVTLIFGEELIRRIMNLDKSLHYKQEHLH